MHEFSSVEYRLSRLSLTPGERHFAMNALAVVKQHHSETTFDMSFLASELGYSRTQVYRKLKKIFGVAGSEFILFVRLETAARLLKTEPMTIEDISKKVGLQCPSYFARRFKLLYGCLPHEYRMAKVNDVKATFVKGHSTLELKDI